MEEILSIIARCRLQAVQLHGNESAALSREIPVKVIKAIRVRDAADLREIATYPAHAFLLDAFVEGKPGGTGTTIPWDLARQATGRLPVILSGGLRPDNVAQAVRAVRPFAVDVSSGVETGPGRKDHRKVRDFIAAVREADRG
jgi:phosphoribosylanthranilate isomerase